jgi:hypothetical protein
VRQGINVADLTEAQAAWAEWAVGELDGPGQPSVSGVNLHLPSLEAGERLLEVLRLATSGPIQPVPMRKAGVRLVERIRARLRREDLRREGEFDV